MSADIEGVGYSTTVYASKNSKNIFINEEVTRKSNVEPLYLDSSLSKKFPRIQGAGPHIYKELHKRKITKEINNTQNESTITTMIMVLITTTIMVLITTATADIWSIVRDRLNT